jgi:competence protein ComEA
MFMFQLRKTPAATNPLVIGDVPGALKRAPLPWLQLLAAVLMAWSAGTALGEPATVNVNAADATVIAEVLDGVGMSRAQAIVEYRQQHGAFADAYDLANVKGIGDRTIELNEDRIRLQD